MRIAQRHETKEIFQQNLQLLEPWLREAVLKIDEEALWEKIRVTYNDAGYPVCQYRRDGKTFKIVSDRPVEEARRWYADTIKQASGAIFLMGSGFGYPLFEIFAHKMSHTLVVVFEQDLHLFAAMLHYFDFEPLIKSEKLVFLAGDEAHFSEAFFGLFRSLNFFGSTYPVIAFTPAAQRNFKAVYLRLYRYVFSQLSLLCFSIGNDHLDNMIGFCNLIANAETVVRSPCISTLKDKYRKVPAFIVANGPSLDKNIGQLEKIAGRGLIISVESAIVPMLKRKIKPDILTIIERSKRTFTYHVENRDFPDDMALLCLGMVDEQVFPSFKGAKIPVFRQGESMNQWINQALGDGSEIDAGTNVSHLAVELAAYLGADPIIFVGQDYAYGPEGATHSKNASYYEKAGKETRAVIESMPVVYVEGNDGAPIPTNKLWKDFKMGLEGKIARHPERLFLNATEGGAKIAGTRCIPLAEAIETYCTAPLPSRVNRLIDESAKDVCLAQRVRQLRAFIESVEKYAVLFHNFAQETLRRKLDCKRMVQLAEMQTEDENKAVLNDVFKKNLAAIDVFLRDSLCRHFTQQIFFIYYYLMNRLGVIDKPEKVTEIFKIQYNTFCYLNIVNQSVGVHLENAAASLREQLSRLEKELEGCEPDECD